jgi:transposase-like protein
MKKNRHSEQKIVAKLRLADVELAKDIPVAQICKKLEISEQTYYRWRKKYGGMDPEMVKKLKALKKENARLKKVVADFAVDNAILREAAEFSKNL